jgi:hypothetical protein
MPKADEIDIVEWRPVVGYEGRYEVSRMGGVRETMGGRLLGQWPSSSGYMIVRLSRPRAQFKVHRLVATAFIPNPTGLPAVNHINSNRADNVAGNLEWCTQAHNIRHADQKGRMQRDYWCGRRSPSARLTDQTASQIRELYAGGGHSHQSLAERFGTNKRTVGRIIAGKFYLPASPSPPVEDKV